MNNQILILFIMIFLHIVDDYYLQGILVKMKQIDWWREQLHVPSYVEILEDFKDPSKYREWKMYRYDWVIALLAHAFSWSFMISLPSIILLMIGHKDNIVMYIIMLLINILVHTLVDDAKANRHLINLVQDQSIHIIQILLTYYILIIK